MTLRTRLNDGSEDGEAGHSLGLNHLWKSRKSLLRTGGCH